MPAFLLLLLACTDVPTDVPASPATPIPAAVPLHTTEAVPGDADDPAIWVDPDDATAGLVLGTDKERPGAVYAYDLVGRLRPALSQEGLDGPNNVTIQTDFAFAGGLVDIAVVTELEDEQLRVYRLPDMVAIDGGGLPVFEGFSGSEEEPAGVGLYRRPTDGVVFAHVSRDAGPTEDYLWTYRLEDDGTGRVVATFVDAFGAFSGTKDIESVVVDDELGVVYYSDELYAVRKYPADPDDPAFGTELAAFAFDGYSEAREGLALRREADGTGYLLVSDQIGGRVMLYPREGTADDPHDHPLVGWFRTQAVETDGMDVTTNSFGGRFPGGLFVSHSDEGTFQSYAWDDLMAVRQPPDVE
jgi:3-phytase